MRRKSERGYRHPGTEIRSARLVIDLFDMPVDKRKAEPIVSTPLFAQSYLAETQRKRETSRVRWTVISVRPRRSISCLIGIRLTCFSFVSRDIYLNYRRTTAFNLSGIRRPVGEQLLRFSLILDFLFDSALLFKVGTTCSLSLALN